MNASSTCALSVPVWRHCCDELRLRAAGHELHEEQRGRDRDRRDEGEDRRDHEHHREHADDGEHRGEQLAQRLLEALGDVVDVVGDPGQQVAAGLAVHVGQREPVDLVLDVGPQPVHGALHHAGQQVRLHVRQQPTPRGRGRARPAGWCAARSKSMPSGRGEAVDDDVGAVAQDAGPDHGERDAADRGERARRSRRTARAASCRAAAGWTPAKSFDFSAGMPAVAQRPPKPARRGLGRLDRFVLGGSSTRSSLIGAPPPGSTARPRSPGRSRSPRAARGGCPCRPRGRPRGRGSGRRR